MVPGFPHWWQQQTLCQWNRLPVEETWILQHDLLTWTILKAEKDVINNVYLIKVVCNTISTWQYQESLAFLVNNFFIISKVVMRVPCSMPCWIWTNHTNSLLCGKEDVITARSLLPSDTYCACLGRSDALYVMSWEAGKGDLMEGQVIPISMSTVTLEASCQICPIFYSFRKGKFHICQSDIHVILLIYQPLLYMLGWKLDARVKPCHVNLFN